MRRGSTHHASAPFGDGSPQLIAQVSDWWNVDNVYANRPGRRADSCFHAKPDNDRSAVIRNSWSSEAGPFE